MTSTRPYDNRLRQERAKETADRIVAALCELLVDERPTSVSIPAVAKRAGVSVRTVYSHYPTKEDLFDAIQGYVDRRMREVAASTGVPLEPTNLADAVRSGVVVLSAMAPLFEAVLRAGIDEGDERGRRRHRRHVEYFVEHLAPLTPDLPDDERRRLATLVTAIVSHPVVVRLQRGGEDLDGATEVLTWTIEHLVADAASAGRIGAPEPQRTKGKP